MFTTRSVLLVLLGLLGVAIWQVGTMLSDDAAGMAAGMLLGAAASIPATFLVLVAARRSTPARGSDIVTYCPRTEDAAPSALWPEQFTAMGVYEGEELLADAPELPVVMLRRLRELQQEYRRRGWECDDVDEWLMQNAARIEAEYRVTR